MKNNLSLQKYSKSKRFAVLAAALGFAFATPTFSVSCADDAQNADVLVANFDGGDYGDWQVVGEAFGTAPASGTLPGQMEVSGFLGAGLVDSFVGGDRSTGTLTSPEVVIVKPFVNFLIGGGGHDGTRFELLVDGRVVRVERGPNVVPGGSERLDWASWDVSEFLGKKAIFRVVDEETGGWGHINVDEIVLSDKKYAATDRIVEISVDRRHLLVPIKAGAPQRWARIEVDGKIEREFEAEFASASDVPDFYANIDAKDWQGKKISLVVEKARPEETFAETKLSDEFYGGEPAYGEKYRPQFHFSPRRGWTNDPNGLVYYKGRYHLFYQHNPFAAKWGNMTWGHATSPDLLHWIEVPDALTPDPLGTIFSGSGAVDWKNTTGFQTDPQGDPPLVFMFTYNGPNMRYGNPASQGLAYSLDGGETFVKYDGNPTIPHIVGGNRDPKIFWHEATSRWIAPLYMDGEDYSIFSSPDLKTWTKTCDVKNLGCSECPDMFALPVDGDASKTLWVFWGGNGKYVLGDFDGETFAPKTAPLDAKWGGNDYAAQTYSDVPGRRIQISWMQGGSYPEMTFTQQFAVPRELTLRSTSDGVRLCINPVEELKTLRGAKLSLNVEKREDGSAAFVPAEGDSAAFDLLDVELVVPAENLASQTVAIRGRKIELNFAEKTMKHDGVVAPLAVVDGKVSLRVVLDRTSIEIFANGGLSQIAKCFVPQDENDAPLVESFRAVKTLDDGRAPLEATLEIYPLRSVWNVEK